ncbi:MAG TPA: metal-sensitive transcriptional regulator [Roseiflexaceae bacterium]|nr:metal-sensitive transcriptional regulator [Roseiflexaceae bacterium]
MAEPNTGRAIPAPVRDDVLLRLRRIEGQIRGIHRMVEDNRDCREVVTQLAAVKAAVASLNTLVAENYARDCLCGGEPIDQEEVSRLLDVLKAAR